MRGSKKRGTSGDLFDKRTQQVLQGIIDNFISTSEPVGSRTLSKTLGLSLSPATIRNIMSDLSDQGYLTQVNTSGGRIPTDKAYRFFVDSLVGADKLPEQLQKNIEEISYQGASAVQDLLINKFLIKLKKIIFQCVQFYQVIEILREEFIRKSKLII